MLGVATVAVRGLEFVLAAVIVGLSATLIHGQVYGDAPTTTRYATFVGALGLLTAIIGAICVFFQSIPDIVPLAMDVVSGLLFLGGGIAWSVGLKNEHCNLENSPDLLKNKLLNEGSLKVKDGVAYGVYHGDPDTQEVIDRLVSNCKKAFADEIATYILFGVCLVLIGLGFLSRRRSGGTSYGRTSRV